MDSSSAGCKRARMIKSKSVSSSETKSNYTITSTPSTCREIISTSASTCSSDQSEMVSTTKQIISILNKGRVEAAPVVPPSAYVQLNRAPKYLWTKLGNIVKAREKATVQYSIPGNYWITLRLDGTGFSKSLRVFRRMGIFCTGYSSVFGSIMQECAKALLKKFSGAFAFTQSDELTVAIAPRRIIRNKQDCHQYNGRVAKMCSLGTYIHIYTHIYTHICV